MVFLSPSEDPMSISSAIRLLTLVLGLGVTLALAAADEKPQVSSLAHFRFNGNAKDENKTNPDFELAHTEFKDGALYLNGKYENGIDKDGYRAVCSMSKWNYATFT